MSTFEIACISFLAVVFCLGVSFEVKASIEQIKYYKTLNEKKE